MIFPSKSHHLHSVASIPSQNTYFFLIHTHKITRCELSGLEYYSINILYKTIKIAPESYSFVTTY